MATIDNRKVTDLDSEEDQRDDVRRMDDQAVQQDLNQGMDTGTNDTTRHAIKWGESYRVKAKKSPIASSRTSKSRTGKK